LKQRCLGAAEVLPKNGDLLLTREMRPQVGKAFFGFLGNSATARPSLSET